MPSWFWRAIAPGAYVADRPPRPLGGQEPNAGLSTPSGAVTGPLFGAPLNFDPLARNRGQLVEKKTWLAALTNSVAASVRI
ncbi:MAG: hypothetical protein HS126_11230 [Anaerolineales bacterium]|nr:hypothetical protein [Anaerolineales bacterium]